MNKKLYIGCWIFVEGIISNYGKTKDGKPTFCIQDVYFGDELLRDHFRIRGTTHKGKGEKIKIKVKIKEYKGDIRIEKYEVNSLSSYFQN